MRGTRQSHTWDAPVPCVGRENHEGEIWLYVPRRSKKLTIQHKDYSVLRDYYDIPVEGARTYEMYLDIGIGRYVTITSQVANSTIYIDGENCGTAPVNHRYLNYGRHTIRATKDRYEGEQTIFVTRNLSNLSKIFQSVYQFLDL